MEGVADVSPFPWGRVGVGLFCLFLCGCITEYNPTGLDEIADILVVEGIITDDESYITLSRSVNLTVGENSITSKQFVNNATVSVECDDGTRSVGYFEYIDYKNARYVINTGTLNPECQYQLKIEVEEAYYPGANRSSISLPTKTFEYRSDFSYPIQTPEIDSVFWTKRGKGQNVMIYVATNDPAGKIQYYRWSFKEDWEYTADVFLAGFPFYCWDKDNDRELLLGSAERTVFGKITEKVTEIVPTSRKLSHLYRIDVTQNVISKRAYDYFANIKKNAQQTGSIFAPIPSELRGNITCITDPGRPVIGYIDVSTTTKKRRFIPYNEGAYESFFNRECEILDAPALVEKYGGIPSDYVMFTPPYPGQPPTYVPYKCVACTYYSGSEQKPGDWPNNH